MTMQKHPLLMHRLTERGAKIAGEEQVITLTRKGTVRQTLNETRRRAHQLAHALAAAGVQQTDHVATLMWNNTRHLEAYYGITLMGAVLHTINVRLPRTDMEYIINHAQDKVIIVDADLVPLLESLKDSIPSVKKVIVANIDDESWQSSLPEAQEYEAFIDGHQTNFDYPDLDEDAPLGLCYTSGTTGKPKGVMYTHRSTYLHTLTGAMTDVMDLSAKDSNCGIVPMFHVMGWGIPWIGLMIGCRQVLPHKYMLPDLLTNLLASEKITISQGVPTIWQNIKGVIEATPDKYDLSNLTRVTCGGSAPPLSLIRWYWDNLGVEMIQGWGMTETSPLGTISRKIMRRSDLNLTENEQFNNIAKAGVSLPGLDLAIFDADFNKLAQDGKSVGEISIRGPWVCSEYYRNPEANNFHKGWLITGDVGTIDEHGYLTITDRSKDLIKTGGEWISSVEMENHIVGLPEVRIACVIGQPHPKWDERPVAVIVANDHENPPDPATIIEHCRKIFAKWQLPDDVVFVKDIPLTATGKINKKVVRVNFKTANYKLPDLR